MVNLRHMRATASQIPSPPAKPAPDLRADATRNRERILRAAREAFATDGIDVPMSTIARRAGVGTATLYRRFPSREALVTEVFTDEATACAAVVDDALDDPDPWRGFTSVVEQITAMQVTNRGFTSAFLSAFPAPAHLDDRRRTAVAGFTTLVRRAKEAGALRPDFEPNDLWLVLRANDGVRAESTEATLAASRRLVAYLLDAFRAEGATSQARPTGRRG